MIMFYTLVVNRPNLWKLFVTVEKKIIRLKLDMTGTGPQNVLKMREMATFTLSALAKIVNSAMEKIKERKLFNTYQHTRIHTHILY